MCSCGAFCCSWVVKPLGELGHIDLGSILVIAREKELRHNLGARSQLIWSGLRGGETCKGRFHLIPRSLHAICGGSDGPSCSQSLPFAKAWDIIRLLLALFSPWWDLTATQSVVSVLSANSLCNERLPGHSMLSDAGVLGYVGSNSPS